VIAERIIATVSEALEQFAAVAAELGEPKGLPEDA